MKALTFVLALAAVTLTACHRADPTVSEPTGSSSPETVVELTTGLSAPWALAALPDGHLLVSERDAGRIIDVAPDGTQKFVGTIPGVTHRGEGGLLGLALRKRYCSEPPAERSDTGCFALYAYVTTAQDNRILSLPLRGVTGARTLGEETIMVAGIPAAAHHNGGRIAFGPDGKLYAGTGDAGNTANAQNPASLGGKILRINPDGTVPPGNPIRDSFVWSLGHRNVQGLAWDDDGRLWASEFGQNTWDELNEIRPGNNYGWPLVEGTPEATDSHPTSTAPGTHFTDPVLTWPTSEASPSGIAIDGTTLFMAALGGERLWQVELDGAPSARARLVNQLGRIRDVALAPNGRLYVLTNNTDGRGSAQQGDDKIVQITR